MWTNHIDISILYHKLSRQKYIGEWKSFFPFSSESNIFKVLWSLALGVERHFINYVIPTVQTTFVLAYAESKKKFTKPFYFVGLHKIPKVQTTFVLWSKVAKSTLLRIFSKSNKFLHFFQLWVTLHSVLIFFKRYRHINE